MKYTVEWCETIKEGEKEGRKWKMTKMSLKDEQGVVTTDVTTFDSVTLGGTVEGSIVQNGQYLNFKKALEKPNFMKHIAEEKKKDIEGFQQSKAKSIAEAQDRSAWMWAKTNASTLLAGKFTGLDNQGIAELVLDLATKIYNGEPTEPFTS